MKKDSKSVAVMGLIVTLLFAVAGILFVGLKDRVEALEEEVRYVNKRFVEYDQSISAFSSYKNLGETAGAALPPSAKSGKNKSIKPIEGYYCAADADERYFVKFNSAGKVGYWIFRGKSKIDIGNLPEPTISGNYILNGGTIFVTIGKGPNAENRRGFIQKVDKRGYILQVEFVGRLYTPSKCPSGLN